MAGQRRFAISRDLYDIHRLVESGTRVSDVIPLLPIKFQARGLDVNELDVQQFVDRRSEFQLDWGRRLTHLVQRPDDCGFDAAWHTVTRLLHRVERDFGDA